jgi:hypothetical protein
MERPHMALTPALRRLADALNSAWLDTADGPLGPDFDLVALQVAAQDDALGLFARLALEQLSQRVEHAALAVAELGRLARHALDRFAETAIGLSLDPEDPGA